MKWYYKIMGGHTHVRVFMNGGKCGDLCFRNEEFDQVRIGCPWIVFIDEDRVARDSERGFGLIAAALLDKHPLAEFKEGE